MKENKIILASLFLVFSLVSCATVDVPNIDGTNKFQADKDEASQWKECEEAQRTLIKSNFVCEDAGLNEYVNQVLHKMTGAIEEKSGVTLKAYVIKDPNFNACAFPNGVIFVHTGLLANLDNEAQLATILGHEATHVFHRHGLKTLRSQVNTAAFFSSLQVIFMGAGSGAPATDLINYYVQMGYQAAVMGYSRDLEREADVQGFAFIEKAGYDPGEAKKAFENLDKAIEKEKIKIPYAYQSHPKVQERIKSMDLLIKELSKNKVDQVQAVNNADVYIAKTKNVLLDNAELDLKRNGIKFARREVEKYAKFYPNDPRQAFLMGKVLILENKIEDAEKELKKAVEIDKNFPLSYKELGLLYYKKGDKPKAKEFFNEYLKINPNANDAEYVRRYINE
ncbi:MAG: M48 family metalloprotease [Candidatus Omnitrophica bacterium]|nr:M48 family metalloprotease [Candidatus Omnitrophota bacterium]